MKTTHVLSAVGALAVLAGAGWAFQFAGATKQNVIATRLEGRWLVDAEITAKLDPAPDSKLPRALDITKDDAVFKKITEVYPRFQTVEPYMSGTAVLNGDKHYFVLMNQEGNSHIVLFTATRENPVGEPHSVHIAMACSRDSGKDMVFLGGDLARESAACYTRVVK